MKRMYWLLPSALLLVWTAGCTTAQKGAAIGAGTGAAAGAVIGNQSGETEQGALLGAAVGALAGAIIGHEVGKKMVCPKCGRKYQETASYCNVCGTRLVRKGTQPAQATGSGKKTVVHDRGHKTKRRK